MLPWKVMAQNSSDKAIPVATKTSSTFQKLARGPAWNWIKPVKSFFQVHSISYIHVHRRTSRTQTTLSSSHTMICQMLMLSMSGSLSLKVYWRMSTRCKAANKSFSKLLSTNLWWPSSRSKTLTVRKRFSSKCEISFMKLKFVLLRSSSCAWH